ncbi:MAG: VOC family protein [Bdellovibrio sp.]|nr:VOC family protein [Bdellovibrio sp.]
MGVVITQENFHLLAQDFLNLLFADLAQKEVRIPAHWDIDHLCYRSASLENYNALKIHFSAFADLLIENPVNGRLIATYQLRKPVQFNEWVIDVVELPAPKASKPTPEGFEHIEIVCDVPFSSLEKQFGHLNLKLDGLTKEFNQEFEIHLGARNIKFHHLSLKSVITLEKSTAAYAALQDSGVLKKFKSYRPVIAGTLPLDIAIEGSALDILMSCENADEAQSQLSAAFSKSGNFRATRTTVDNLDTLIVQFNHNGVPFKIFVQNRECVQQAAYLHFLCEERLLKLKGLTLRDQIRSLRQQGLKTDAAFAKALKIAGDPYELLLSIQKLTNSELLRL